MAEYRRFSLAQKELLKQEGGFIIPSNGETINDLKKRRKKFWTKQQEDFPLLKTFPSLRSEIAIFPDRFYLPKSNNKTFREQEAMVVQFEQELKEQYDLEKVKAVLGNTPTHAFIAFSYHAETGKRLHGKEYNYAYVRTKNPPAINPRIVDVGFFSDQNELGINCHPEQNDYLVYAAPLILPK